MRKPTVGLRLSGAGGRAAVKSASALHAGSNSCLPASPKFCTRGGIFWADLAPFQFSGPQRSKR